MSWKDKCPRPYYKNYERVTVMNDKNWFEVYKLPGNVFAIAEPYHCEEVNCYLIIGTDKAVLFDTGLGFFSIKDVAEELYDGEIVVVNSHSHFDHIGCNGLFDKIFAFDDALSRYTANKGAPHSVYGDQLNEEMFFNGYPEGFDAANFSVPPYHFTPLKEGEMIDLGNRKLEVIHTPGHSSDSIMLFDREQGILFTGDTFYLAALYAHFDCEEFGKSDLSDYIKSLNKIINLGEAVKNLYCEHNEFIALPGKLRIAIEAMREILNDSIKNGSSVDTTHQYLEEKNKIVEYFFDGFSIVCRV